MVMDSQPSGMGSLEKPFLLSLALAMVFQHNRAVTKTPPSLALLILETSSPSHKPGDPGVDARSTAESKVLKTWCQKLWAETKYILVIDSQSAS